MTGWAADRYVTPRVIAYLAAHLADVDVMHRPSLGNAQSVLWAACKWARREPGGEHPGMWLADPTVGQLEASTGLPGGTVRNALHALEAIGVTVTLSNGGGRGLTARGATRRLVLDPLSHAETPRANHAEYSPKLRVVDHAEFDPKLRVVTPETPRGDGETPRGYHATPRLTAWSKDSAASSTPERDVDPLAAVIGDPEVHVPAHVAEVLARVRASTRPTHPAVAAPDPDPDPYPPPRTKAEANALFAGLRRSRYKPGYRVIRRPPT